MAAARPGAAAGQGAAAPARDRRPRRRGRAPPEGASASLGLGGRRGIIGTRVSLGVEGLRQTSGPCGPDSRRSSGRRGPRRRTGRRSGRRVPWRELAVSTVHRIWKAHGPGPHRGRVFRLSKGECANAVAEQRVDIVGLYATAPAHAVVLPVDEGEPANAMRPREQANQIQALDRTRPGLPMKTGRAGASCGPHASAMTGGPQASGMTTHDDKRRGTAPLFAARSVEGTDHRPHHGAAPASGGHPAASNALEREIPAGTIVHAILDTVSPHKIPELRRRRAHRPRSTFPVTPTPRARMNAPSRRMPAQDSVARGSSQSTPDAARRRPPSTPPSTSGRPSTACAEHTAPEANPVASRADPDTITAARSRALQPLASIR